jgi:chemotaxis protein methyltransferase CheR
MRSVPKLDEWNVSVLATDINPRFLAKADAGVYSDWSFRGTPDWVKERFFSPMPDRKMAIKPEVRRLVQFSFLNLARDIYPSLHNQTNAMDVIFCRNVLMYLTSGHQRTVVAALHRCLVDGGILLVNPAEATPALFPMFAVENRDGIILFRKTSQPTHPEPRPVFVASVPLPVVPAIEPVFQAPREPSAPVASSPREVPPPPPASFETATRLFAEGDWDAAEAQLTQIAQVEPDRARSLLLLARIHANQGRLDDALTLCQRAIVTERTNPSAYFLFATICNELGQLEEAIAAQNKALYLDQDFILAHHALSGLYKRLGKQKQARRHLSVALDLLSARSKGEIVPESDGMTCGRLVEAVRAMKGE